MKDLLPTASSFTKFAYTGGAIALLVYAVGVGLSFALPEPPAELKD
jgi:hypothetical protein